MILAGTKRRILQYLDCKGIAKSIFFKTTGIKRGLLDGDKLNATVSDVVIAKIIATYNDLNAEWLLTGQGEMLKQPPGAPSADGAAQISEVAEPEAVENVFSGLTQDEVEEELKNGIRDVIIEMYENGEAYPAVVVRQYQDQIKELVGQVARLEYQLQELGFTQVAGACRPGRDEDERAKGGQIKKSR